MSASTWDRAVEAAFDNLFHREDCSHVDALSEFHPRSRERLRLALAAALPVLLEELAQRIEHGGDATIAAVAKGDLAHARYASIKAEGVRCALGTIRGFAAEVTQ